MTARGGWARVVSAAVLVPLLAVTSAARWPAHAAPLPPTGSATTTRDADLGRVVRALESRVVAAHLRGLGLDSGTVAVRLARLDDGELHRLARAVSEAGLGGQDDTQRPMDTERMLGTILILLVALAVFGGLIYFTIAGF